MAESAYNLAMPEARSSCAVFASPHSGRDYPFAFLQSSVLDERAIRSSEDAFIDILFEAAPRHGAPLLAARMPRAYVDLNRHESELDPAVIRDVAPGGHNPRVASGLGVIPRVVAGGRAIMSGKMDRTEAEHRLDRFHRPYHRRLRLLLDEAQRQFGQAILFDCHSMPHEALVAARYPAGETPDVVLGDLFGAACDRGIVEQVEGIFLGAGLSVARNAPFAGAFAMQQYGRPTRRQHALQIEIDRSLYMNEAMVRPNGNFHAFQKVMGEVVAALADIGRSDMSLAAE